MTCWIMNHSREDIIDYFKKGQEGKSVEIAANSFIEC